jgi:hypothetical protein
MPRAFSAAIARNNVMPIDAVSAPPPFSLGAAANLMTKDEGPPEDRGRYRQAAGAADAASGLAGRHDDSRKLCGFSVMSGRKTAEGAPAPWDTPPKLV